MEPLDVGITGRNAGHLLKGNVLTVDRVILCFRVGTLLAVSKTREEQAEDGRGQFRHAEILGSR